MYSAFPFSPCVVLQTSLEAGQTSFVYFLLEMKIPGLRDVRWRFCCHTAHD